MAGKAIDLEFTVAEASRGDILGGLRNITADANKDSEITGIRFKLADDGKELRGSLQSALNGISDDLSKTVSKSLGKSTSSSSNVFKDMQGDIAKTTKQMQDMSAASGSATGKIDKEIAAAVARMKSLNSEMKSIKNEMAKAAPDADTSKLQQQLQRVQKEYNELQDSFGKGFSLKQVDDLVYKMEQVDRALERTDEKLKNTASQKAQANALKETAQIYQELLDKRKQITDLNIQKLSLNPDNLVDAAKLSETEAKLKSLRAEYAALKKEFYSRDNHTIGQSQDLKAAARQGEERIAAAKAQLAAAQQQLANDNAAKQLKSDYQELLSLYEKTANAEVKMHKAELGGDAGQISETRRQYEELVAQRNQLQASLSTKLTDSQLEQLNHIADEAKANIQDLNTSYQQTQQQMAAGIKMRIDTGSFDAQINLLKNQMQSLGSYGAQAKDQIAEMEQQLAAMKQEGASDAAINSAMERYNQLLQVVTERLRLAGQEAKAFGIEIDASTAKAAAGDLMDRMTASLNDYSAGALLARGKVKELIAQLQALQNTGDTTKLVEGVKNIGAAFDDVQSRAASFQTAFQKFTSKMSTGIKQALGISTVGMAVRKAVQEGKKMYKEVLDIDTAMTGLYKVTDETSERYDQFLKSTSKNAQKLGSTISGLIDQSATWAKLGYSMDESEQLAQISSIYAHVGEVDNDTAVSDLITSMKAFNITAEDSVTIVDRLNELGNNYAVSSADLGAALARSASSLKLAGTDIDKALAMVTGGSEITQKPAEFGNFLKIAVMRIRGMKGELEELGEDVDHTVDSISKVQTQILNRTHGKVNIFGDDGEFRDYYEIMKEISEVWDELNSKDRASLSEILFGKVRSNQGAALIQAFQSGQVEKALNTSLNSQGSAMKEYERWMQSLEAKTNQFKAAYQNLSQTVLSSDFLKGAVDTGTNFLNVLTKIIDKIGILPTLLGAGGALFGVTHIGKHYCPAWA